MMLCTDYVLMRSNSVMSKLKSHSGASKRFKVTGSGKVKCRGAFRNHILTKKSTKKKRHFRVDNVYLSPADAKLAKRMLQGS